MKCECNQIIESYPTLCVSLAQYRLIEMAGADAEKYLQGQLTCDVTKLAVGDHTLTSHCDPKGKMSSLFRLYRAEQEKFIAVIHQSLLPEALTQLKKYAVFSKITFSELDTPIYGVAAEQVAKLSEKLFVTSDEVTHGSAAVGKANVQKAVPFVTALTISEGQKRAFVWGETLETNADESLWTLMDIQDGIPVLVKENQFELIPQAANLQQIEAAISFTKGCYIGQETVARAKYRGANKRALFTLAGQYEGEISLPEPASAVEMQLGENWRATGTILACETHKNTLWVQVVLNKEVEVENQFRVNGVNLKIVELPYSLEEE
ncbi:hypothetical protein MHD_10685 [Mannheimia granulomatis]|uniref:tRNA-modifying protein YgfZ-like beta-barrel domain-containing protein n=1 Tax=Mannheimia granulomatis TaxID=85402 RepID=A0A011N9J3_9PAST|nr:tRNA-modifying protein YgfZ [Mannheimia granulomatis]EXI61282.1 hypothetical protein AK33_11075 [Mannheimia granulomatis]RGE47246.1 hypothetical protein MHD_10685 [Mannheimia granulomatis]